MVIWFDDCSSSFAFAFKNAIPLISARCDTLALHCQIVDTQQQSITTDGPLWNSNAPVYDRQTKDDKVQATITQLPTIEPCSRCCLAYSTRIDYVREWWVIKDNV